MLEVFIGQVTIFAGNYAPEGWAKCEGQIIPIEQNMPLFSLIGTTYGGDGQRTFALPDLRGKGPVAVGVEQDYGFLDYIIALRGSFPKRS
jgi:microcystin-dependent protein